MTVRTWMVEAAVVATVMAAVAALTGGTAVQWLSAAAVLFSFMHAQVAERMAEHQARAVKPDVECWRWSRRYFLGKELAWCAVFTLTKAWPALAGVAVFLAYPAWRRLHRSLQVGRCDTCRRPATHLWRDEIPIPHETEERFELGALHRACDAHRPPSRKRCA